MKDCKKILTHKAAGLILALVLLIGQEVEPVRINSSCTSDDHCKAKLSKPEAFMICQGNKCQCPDDTVPLDPEDPIQCVIRAGLHFTSSRFKDHQLCVRHSKRENAGKMGGYICLCDQGYEVVNSRCQRPPKSNSSGQGSNITTLTMICYILFVTMYALMSAE